MNVILYKLADLEERIKNIEEILKFMLSIMNKENENESNNIQRKVK